MPPKEVITMVYEIAKRIEETNSRIDSANVKNEERHAEVNKKIEEKHSDTKNEVRLLEERIHLLKSWQLILVAAAFAGPTIMEKIISLVWK